MNTRNELSTRTVLGKRVVNGSSPETRALISLGRQYGWDFAVLGRAPMPAEPVRLGGWIVVPAHKDSSPLPPRAMQRVQSIFAEGISLNGLVLVHETTRLLPPPSRAEALPASKTLLLSSNVRTALKTAGTALGVIALMVIVVSGLVVVAFAALMAAAALLAPVALLAGAVAVDPILVAVTEDGYWIEIDRWDV